MCICVAVAADPLVWPVLFIVLAAIVVMWIISHIILVTVALAITAVLIGAVVVMMARTMNKPCPISREIPQIPNSYKTEVRNNPRSAIPAPRYELHLHGVTAEQLAQVAGRQGGHMIE